jgi:hypothetical protein
MIAVLRQTVKVSISNDTNLFAKELFSFANKLKEGNLLLQRVCITFELHVKLMHLDLTNIEQQFYL